MSTASSRDSEIGLTRRSGPSHDPGTISTRKAKHLEICVDQERYRVETADPGFSELRFLHRSLPEVDEGEVDTSLSFLGHEIALPILISCMTGGSVEGTLVNKQLAEAAARARVPVGMGSIRILFRDESYFDQFYMKPLAPDVPVIANLSAVQIRDIDHGKIVELLKRLEVQALAVHLNAGQELFQPNGDRDFRGIREAIASFCDFSPIPVIVKETGFGIRPSEVEFLIGAGATAVDLAGAGGTNWVRVESYRLPEAESMVAQEFDDWGIPTALLLAALEGGRGAGTAELFDGRVIASGGLRSGSDVAKSIALGAHLSGLALPFARAVTEGGVEAVVAEIDGIGESLRSIMTLTGSTTLAGLRRQRLMRSAGFSAAVAELVATDGGLTATDDE